MVCVTMESVNVLKDGKENIAKIELVLKIVMIMDYVIMLNAFANFLGVENIVKKKFANLNASMEEHV